jgi:hypothetical protein
MLQLSIKQMRGEETNGKKREGGGERRGEERRGEEMKEHKRKGKDVRNLSNYKKPRWAYYLTKNRKWRCGLDSTGSSYALLNTA